MPDHTTHNLYRVDDVVQLRGTDPPTLAIVVDVRGGLVLVAYRAVHGQPQYQWLVPADLIQMTTQYAMQGIPPGLEALRGTSRDEREW